MKLSDVQRRTLRAVGEGKVRLVWGKPLMCVQFLAGASHTIIRRLVEKGLVRTPESPSKHFSLTSLGQSELGRIQHDR